MFYDEESSEDEDRFLMLGFNNESCVLLVCHCEGSQVHISELFLLEKLQITNVNTTKVAPHEARV
jgi:hypothetical protein